MGFLNSIYWKTVIPSFLCRKSLSLVCKTPTCWVDDPMDILRYPMDYIPTQQVGIHELIIMLFIKDKPYSTCWFIPYRNHASFQHPPMDTIKCHHLRSAYSEKARRSWGNKKYLFQGITFPQMISLWKDGKIRQISVLSLKNDIWKFFCDFVFVQNIIFVWVTKGFLVANCSKYQPIPCHEFIVWGLMKYDINPTRFFWEIPENIPLHIFSINFDLPKKKNESHWMILPKRLLASSSLKFRARARRIWWRRLTADLFLASKMDVKKSIRPRKLTWQ